jgi:polyisoprenyl-teichoic acid--peptidoglycan teichoic acid transferase
MPPEPPSRAWWMSLRVLLAVVGITLLSAAGTAALAFDEVGKLVDALGQSRAVRVSPQMLAPTRNGAPQTLLLVGNDQRPPPKGNPNGAVVPHSNEMLLIRIDPSRPTISMLSIPRELRVTFTAPNGETVTNRFNSAYTYGYEQGGGTSGGVKLMLQTIEKALGLTVNHVFVTDFPRFRRAVDEMGCVYGEIDKRYHHVNEPGGEQYFEINLQPGYQRLCGREALEFVANRHESTSLTRDARDQRFMLEVKKQYGPSLFEEREKFEHILGRAIETDLHGEEQVLDLLELLIGAAGKPVRQVPFQVSLLSSYDTATERQIHESVRQFLGGTSPIAKGRLSDAIEGANKAPAKAAAQPSMTPTGEEALDRARSVAPELPFALEYPRIRNAFASAEPDQLRTYGIRDEEGHRHPSYVVVIDRGLLGQYYDVQGTTWLDPPLLRSPSETVQIGSRSYSLYDDGEHVKTIAWHEGGAVYWIENTLTNSVSPREMLEIAQETQPVDRTIRPAPQRRAKAAQSALRQPAAWNASQSRNEEIAVPLGAVSLLGLALLLVALLRRRRELRKLRGQMAQTLTLGAPRPPAR